MTDRFTIRQAACLIGVTEHQVCEWIDSGILRAVSVDEEPAMIEPADLDTFVSWRIEQTEFHGVATDREQATRAVRCIYQTLGYPPPRVVFVGSPLVLRLAASMAAAIIGLAEDCPFGQLYRDDTEIFNGLTRRARAALNGVSSPNEPDPPDAREDDESERSRRIWQAIREQRNSLAAHIERRVDNQLQALAQLDTPRIDFGVLNRELNRAVIEALGWDLMPRSDYADAFPLHTAEWYVRCIFLHEPPPWDNADPLWVQCMVADACNADAHPVRYPELQGIHSRNHTRCREAMLIGMYRDRNCLDGPEFDALQPFEELMAAAGYWWMHPRFVMIADPPRLIRWRERAGTHWPYLHCETGPALVFPDGWEEYVIHGTVVPHWLATQPAERIAPERILEIDNDQARAQFIRKVGIERVCHALNAEAIDRQGDYELLLLDLKDGRRRPFLKMLNPSVPELWHVEGVHPSCRTVTEALAWRNGTTRSPERLA